MRLAILMMLGIALISTKAVAQPSTDDFYKSCIAAADFLGTDKEPCDLLRNNAPRSTPNRSLLSRIPDEYWAAVPAHGDASLHFMRQGTQLSPEQISVGDVLVSKRQLDVRRIPTPSAVVIFALDKGTSIKIEEKKILPASSGSQRLWLRIANADHSAVPIARSSRSAQQPVSSEAAYQKRLLADASAQAVIAEKVSTCFKAGTAARKFMSFSEMRDCAGVWVSPKALVRCMIEVRLTDDTLGDAVAHCPAIPDTSEGRAAFDAVLKQYGPSLTRDGVLHLDTGNLPPFPTSASIETCKAVVGAVNSVNCVSKMIDGGKYNPLVECFSRPNETARLACFAESVNNANFTVLMGCMSGGSPTLDKLVSCTPNARIKDDAEKLRNCTESAVKPQDVARCLADALPPPQQAFANCAAVAGSPEEAGKCLDHLSPEVAKARLTVGCMADGGNNAVGCAAGVLPGDAGVLARCISDAKTSDKWADCSASSNAEVAKIRNLTKCMESNASKAACASKYIGGDSAAFAACMSDGKSSLQQCLKRVNSALGGVNEALSCISNSSDAAQAFACAAPRVGGDAAKIATCVANPDRAVAAICLLGDKPEARAAQRAYRCISDGTSVSSLIANCSEGLLDPKTSQAVSCVARAGTDKAQLASCAASVALPADAARLVGCVASSQGPTSFALCAASPAMNEEWRIAAECAVQSGGNPVGFAGCTAGRLTLKEITQCFNGKGCFGPNNTIIKTYTNAFNDLTKGPGPNNEGVKFINSVRDLAGGPNSVINKPEQLKGGPNSMINDPGQIWGGESSVFNQAAGGKNSEVRKVLRALDPTTWRF